MPQVYIETYGCANNRAESEIMAGLLERAGLRVVSLPEEADVIIVNTCDVKLTTRNKVLFRLRELSSKFGAERIVIAGCMPEIEYSYLKSVFPRASLLSTNYADKVVGVVEDVLKGERVELIGYRKCEKVCLPRVTHNPLIRIVPICSGCNSACSFCVTKLAKGPIFSFETEKIVKEIKLAKESGAKEFWLTGQDVACYGLDFAEKSLLPELLRTITSEVKGKYFLRVGMMNPKNVLPILPELLEAMSNENIFKFFHLPVQSGSDKVLREMRRGYEVGEFVRMIREVRKASPLSSIWTDMIVAFPGETEEDFSLSCKLIESLQFDYVNVSRFSPHRLVPASNLPQLPTQIAKERSKKMSSLVRHMSELANRKWIGWEGEALVDEYIVKKKSYIARNFAYKPIVLECEDLELGKWVEVKVVAASHSSLFGKVI